MIKCGYKGCHACYSKAYEDKDILFLYRFIAEHDNSVFLDVGAHVGLYIYKISQLLNKSNGNDSSCRMIAVEPDRSIYSALKTNIGLHMLLPMAAWHADEILFLSKQGKHIGRMREDGVDDDAELITAIPLDILGSHISFEPYSLTVKIDVEGAEHKVILGLKNTLRASRSGALVVELSSQHLKEYGSSVDDVVDSLLKSDYRVEKKSESKLNEARKGLKRNVHFVKE